MRKVIAFRSGISGVVLYVITAIISCASITGYDHVSQLLSEAYATDVPHQFFYRFFGYLPAGILICIFCYMGVKIFSRSRSARTGFICIGLFYGIGTAISAYFNCAPGCKFDLNDPEPSQLIHNLMAFLTYIFTPAGMFILGISARRWQHAKLTATSALTGSLVCYVFTGILFMNPTSEYIGLYQRIIEACILGWIIICSFYFIKSAHGPAIHYTSRYKQE